MVTNDCHNLDAFLDGELAPGESARFAAHLAQCPTCREAVDEQQWIDGLLRAPAIAQLNTPPSALVETFRGALARRIQFTRLAAGGLAVAAMLLIAAGWTAMKNRQADGPRDADVAAVVVVSEEEFEPAPALQPATFVGGPDVIVVPIVSKHPDVTIVRVYPTYQPDYAAQAILDQSNPGDEFAWPDLNGG